MNNNEWNIKIVDSGYKLTKDVYIFREIGEKVEFLDGETVHRGVAVSKPTLELTLDQLQVFADALNNIGIKPKQGYLEGKLEATEKHLEDMRKLAL